MLSIDHDEYVLDRVRVETTDDGTRNEVRTDRDRAVDRDYVENYLGAKSFREGLGGTERHTKRSGGVIVVESYAPDHTTERPHYSMSIFTPGHPLP